MEHEVRMSTNVEMRNLQISRALAPLLPAFTCAVKVTSLLRELLLTAIAGPNYFYTGDKQERVVGLIVEEFEESELAPMHLPEPRDPRLVRVCDALREAPGDQRTLEEWAEVACASSRTLARMFVQDTGMSFAAWRRQARLLSAIIRLSNGESVSTVALDAGYETASGFIEMFRRQIGCTPGQYVSHAV
ncbi:MAG: AraC family transcriptional regulator [Burkholderiales bacterium]